MHAAAASASAMASFAASRAGACPAAYFFKAFLYLKDRCYTYRSHVCDIHSIYI